MKRSSNSDKWKNTVHAYHGDKYDYSCVVYTGVHDKVEIICPIHGTFHQTPQNHKRSGCPDCGKIKSIISHTGSTQKTKGKEHYLGKLHDRTVYDYSLVPEDVGNNDKVEIICNIHGVFHQRFGMHVLGQGCPTCGHDARQQANIKPTLSYIESAISVHHGKYDYTNVSEKCGVKEKVEILCPDHGAFHQTLDKHIYSKCGCPVCGSIARSDYSSGSSTENEISQFLIDSGVDLEVNNRSIIYPKELDIVIKDHNLAIEVHGLYWHSEQMGKERQYHYNKYKKCKDVGVRLIQIFEDEWEQKKEIVKSKLLHVIGISNENRHYARSCVVNTVPITERKVFLDNYHIQGNVGGSYTIGLYNTSDVLVACMVFVNNNDGTFVLTRYATSGVVLGGFNKLLTFFKNNNKWTSIYSFADLRWSNGDVYLHNGWQVDKELPPDYSYVKGVNRIHKFNYRRKNLKKLLDVFDPTKSETENCISNGLKRIWDSGKLRVVLHNKII